MAQNLTPETKAVKIRRYWEQQVKDRGLAIQAGSFDYYLKLLEVEIILKWFQSHFQRTLKVLDVGCGTGYTVCCLANLSNLKLYGVDYSPKIIAFAQKRRSQLRRAEKARVTFAVGDVTKLPFENESFDVVITERVIINLANLKQQKRAIGEIWRVLKNGGVYLSFEGYKQGFDALNQLREKFGLESINETWSNLKLDKDTFFPFFKKYFYLTFEKHFGCYYFLSRIVHPLLVWPRQPKYKAKINKVAYEISKKFSGFDGLGHLIFLELRKKS